MKLFNLRTLIFILTTLRALSPLLGKGRKQKLPGSLKEVILLLLTNSELLWKWLEKRGWTIETLKTILKNKNSKS